MAPDIHHPSDETLIRAADGELPAATHAGVEQHLGVCGACAARDARLRGALAALVQAGRERGDGAALSRAFRARVQGEVTRLSRDAPAPPADPRGAMRSRRSAAAALAAAALLALAVYAADMWRTGAAKDETLLAVQSGVLPVPALTPGATRPVPVSELCSGGAAAEREIAGDVRQAVLRDYRMESVPAHEYELDYLITPELGGSADRRNLWPERYGVRVWNARVKDELEHLLPELVCRGDVDLATAQRDIAANWIAAYKKYFHTDRPVGARAGARLHGPHAAGFLSFFVSAPLVSTRRD